MLNFGKYNNLLISRRTAHGFYLCETEGKGVLEEVLLPNKFITPAMKEGQTLNVFVYKDSEDRPVATTQTPKVLVDEIAWLQVKQLSGVGAFLDWGLDKDLLLPFREQNGKMEEGKSYPVFVYFDYASKRIASTNNLNKFIKNRDIQLKPNEEVNLMVTEEIEPGFKVVVNNKHWGIIYKNEIFGMVKPGDRLRGFVKKIREDGKIDIALQKQGIVAAKDTTEVILAKLKENGGVLALNDDSPPELIYQTLGISKKNFKKALGMLYKQGKVVLLETGIKLK